MSGISLTKSISLTDDILRAAMSIKERRDFKSLSEVFKNLVKEEAERIFNEEELEWLNLL